jgi:hypothetical protein
MKINDSQFVHRDIPIFLWIFGLIFAGVGILILLEGGRAPAMGLLFTAIGLGFLLFTSLLTITADRVTRTLRLEYRSALRHAVKEISFDDIAGINIERSSSHGSGRTRTTYGVVLKKKDGQMIRFRSFSSSGSGKKDWLVGQLREFIGVQGFDTAPPVYAELQSHAGEIRETNGVHWQVKPIVMGGGPAGACWFSPDFKAPDVFLYVAQKAEGQASGGFLASLGSLLFKQSISMYGFQPDDTPGIDRAAVLSPLDPAIEPHFMAYTNDPDFSRRMLNSNTVGVLVDWAGCYPIKQFQKSSDSSQLVMLIGPKGLYLARLNLTESSQANELSALGVAIVKSQI